MMCMGALDGTDDTADSMAPILPAPGPARCLGILTEIFRGLLQLNHAPPPDTYVPSLSTWCMPVIMILVRCGGSLGGLGA